MVHVLAVVANQVEMTQGQCQGCWEASLNERNGSYLLFLWDDGDPT